MTMLRIYLLGGLRVYYGENPLPPFPTQKTRSLFAYLVTFRQDQHPRGRLATIFWPHRPLPQARRNLNTTLWRLRRTLPSGYLRVEADTIAFHPDAPYWLDVAAFEQSLQEGGVPLSGEASPPVPLPKGDCLRQAVELYRGDLLEGLYEEWCLVEAERLRLLYTRALHGLLSYHRAGGAHEEALNAARRLLAVDPLREDVHQQVIELYAALGRPGEARTHFETCRRLLQEELGVDPMPETVALYGRIEGGDRAQTAAVSPPPSLPSPASPLPRTPFDDLGRVGLVGREGELDWLLERAEQVPRQGRGAVLLVEGAPGTGKTRLMEEVARCVEGHGWLQQWGHCREFKKPPPYQGWIEALRAALSQVGLSNLAVMDRSWLSEIRLLLPELGRLFPGLPEPADLPPEQRQRRLQQALWHFLAGLARLRPVLLILEDLQWADEATVQTLCYIATHLSATPVLVIGTARSEEIPPDQREVLGRLGDTELQRLSLSPLSRTDTGRLAGQILGWLSPAPAFVDRLYRETGGNPFFLIEILKGLYEEGLLAWDRAGRWNLQRTLALEQAVWPLSQGLRRAIQRRLDRLDLAGRQLLELAAVLGKVVEFDLLWQVSGWAEETILEVTDDLLRRQLLVEIDEQFHFSHDKIQEVVYRGISPSRCAQLHQQTGDLLAGQEPERVEELAQHFFLGRQPERALPYCLRAGERARLLYANQSALTYYSWAIEAAGAVGGEEKATALLMAHEKRGQIWEHLGNYDRAVADFSAMQEPSAALSDGASLARAVRRVAWIQGDMLGDWEQGLEGAERALALAEAAGSRREATIALLDMGYFHNMRGEYGQALDRLGQALSMARDRGDEGAKAASLQFLAVAYRSLCRYREALATSHEAAQIWYRRRNRRAEAHTWADIGSLHLRLGELDSAEAAFDRAKAILKEIEAHRIMPWVLIGSAALQRCRGASAQSLCSLERAWEIEGMVGESAYHQALIRFHQGWAHWDQGELGSALDCMEQALALARQSGTPNLLAELLNGWGVLLHSLGQIGSASEAFVESLALSRQTAFLAGEATACLELGLIELAQGDWSSGWVRVAKAVRLTRSLGPRARMEALVGLAEACLVRGDLQPARALARRAAALLGEMGLHHLRVRALRFEGQALGRLGRCEEAERALRRALEEASPPGYPVERWRIVNNLALVVAEQGRTAEATRLQEQARGTVGEILDRLPRGYRPAFRGRPAVAALLGETDALSLRPGQIRHKLARRGAPTGRPLHEAEQVSVVWTVDAGPGDAALRRREGKVALRRHRILRLLGQAYEQGGDPTEANLAAVLEVSERTIRSDIAALRQAGYPVRTRGTRA